MQRRCASESSWDPRLHPSGLKPAAQGDAEAAESSKPAKGKPAGGNETTKSPATSTSHPSGSALPKPRLDFKKITAQAEATTLNAILRRAPVPRDTVFHITRLYETSLTLRRKIDAVKHQQRDIGLAIKAGGGAAAVEQARKLKGKVGEYVAVLEETERELMELGLRLPNDTYPGTPVGSEAHAIELERLGRPVTKEEETAGPDPMRDHLVIAEHWDWIDPPASAISTGTSWPYLKSTLALLEQSLVQYAMSVAVAEGWTPVVVPDVVKEDVMVRCGFTPRDPSQVGQTYYVSTAPRGTEDQGTGGNLVLGATAEIPLAALSANKILPPTALPIKYVGVSHSFRAEAGARGADTRGLYRLHQFTKVELFAVTGHEDPASGGMMSQILALQKRVVRGLGLSVRVVEMPTEELGAPAWRKVDMEAWMPGRGKWGEVGFLRVRGWVGSDARRRSRLLQIVETTSPGVCTSGTAHTQHPPHQSPSHSHTP